MKKKIIGAAFVGIAGAGLIAFGAGTANADPECLIQSVQGAAADPAGALTATLADPAGALKADAACVQEVLKGADADYAHTAGGRGDEAGED